jgi:hypothetical protein
LDEKASFAGEEKLANRLRGTLSAPNHFFMSA